MISAHIRGFFHRVARYRRDVANTLSVEVISLVSLAIIFPLTVRHLGDHEYGQYTALYLVYGLAGAWVSAAPSAAMVQLILQEHNDSRALLRIARRQALLFCAPIVPIGTAITVALYGSDVFYLALAVMTLDFLFTTYARLDMAVVFAVSGIAPTTRIKLVYPVFRAAGTVGLAATGVLTISTLVGLNVAASAALMLMSRWARRRASQDSASTTPSGRALFRYTTYYAASMSTNEMQNEGENLVMASTRPAAELGQYAAAYRVVSMSLVPLAAVVSAANRWFLVRDDRAGAQFKRTIRLAVPTAFYGAAAGLGILLFRNVIQWIAGPDFDEVSTIAAWLCLLPLLHGLADLPSMGLLGLARNRARTIMGVVTSIISVAAYLLLVPSMGWRGGVIGTYISETVTVVAGFSLLYYLQQRADRSARVMHPAPDDQPLPAS